MFETKKEYRVYAKELRASLTSLNIEEISFLICENIKKQDFYKKAKNILGFYPFNSEIDLTELYKDSSKNWYLPSINPNTKEMSYIPMRMGMNLLKTSLGLLNPLLFQNTIWKKLI